MIADAVVVDQWPKNRRELFRVTLGRHNDRAIIDVRLWYVDEQGELRPTKRGLITSTRQLNRLAAALVRAEAMVRASGPR